jgi:6-phosphogluconolactonase (cycloisomerase 2 family)
MNSLGLSRYALAIGAGAALLAGCGGSEPPISGVTMPSAEKLRSQKPAPHFVYVTNKNSNSVSAYAIDAGTGALTDVKGSPFKAGSYPIGLAIDRPGMFVYAVNANNYDGSSPGSISAYAIEADSGVLDQVPGSPFATGYAPFGIAVDKSGKFAYVADEGANDVLGYRISASTGALTLLNWSHKAGFNPFDAVADPINEFLYVVNRGGTVYGYRINASTGALKRVKGSPFKADLYAYNAAIDPAGKFIYITDGDNEIFGYRIDASSGTLRPMQGSPFRCRRGVVTPFGIAIAPSGKFAYVTNSGSNNVSAYSIDPTTGALQAKGPPHSTGDGSQPSGVAIDPDGSFLYVADWGTAKVSAFAINSHTGSLKAVKGSPFKAGTYPTTVAIR